MQIGYALDDLSKYAPNLLLGERPAQLAYNVQTRAGVAKLDGQLAGQGVRICGPPADAAPGEYAPKACPS